MSGFGETISPFSTDKAGFTVRVKNEESCHRIFFVSVLPNSYLNLHVTDRQDRHFELETTAGRLTFSGKQGWEWMSPESPGLYSLRIRTEAPADSMLLNVFVLVPLSELQGEYLNGFRIGHYPQEPLRGMSIYNPPDGFIEVTRKNRETMVSPHFRLEQFLCKQGGGYPQYLVLRERLVLKLEVILEALNTKGYTCRSFAVMSGYRTPYYNKLIGNVVYSRHVWGGAADIYIDENPQDGIMDDLNRDGIINYRDAEVLYDIVDQMFGASWYERFVGGLARYRKTSHHGPFVHIDVRGYRARWGR